ncbi:MAG TPA: acyltransferase family protein [Rhodoferax sp.]|jgi:peptidoglycan/LPS O-acetylase OafA/YrhL|nr:acyltransferase family protein [Rhodoferax sp.]HQY77056.1 acyltransferase family protein [Rhodoferax sp.]
MLNKNLVYRPDIDGLRSIAIIPVLIYHAFPTFLTGGFIGVDVFFVISGYLITTIVVTESFRERFSYRSFYSRRIRRLFPVLLTALTVSLVIGWSLLLDVEYKQLARHTLAGLLFASNVNLWTELGYFDAASDLKPLLHLWSLGVEEQFYLIWPALAMALGPRLSKSPKLSVVIFIALFLLCGMTAYFSQEAAFYLPFARFWELYAGAGLAFYELRQTNSTEAGVDAEHASFSFKFEAMGVIGLTLILIPAYVIDREQGFPFPTAIFPVAGTILLLTSRHSFVNRRLLSSRIFVGIGLISYALYIWHWPLLSFLNIEFNGTPPNEWRIGAIGLAIVLSTICYWTVEMFFRRKGREILKLCILASVSVLIGIVASNIYLRDGLGFRMDSVISDVIGAKDDHQMAWRSGECFIDQEEKDSFAPTCVGSMERPDVLLWGDSHAAALYPGLAKLLVLRRLSLAQYTGALCKPLLGDADLSTACKRNNQFVMDVIAKSQPGLVVLSARWVTVSDLGSLAQTVTALRNVGVTRIALVGPSPSWKDDLPRLVFAYYRKHHAVPPQWLPECNFESTTAEDRTFANAAKGLGLAYVSFLGTLYSSTGCPLRTSESSKDIMMFDADHLTVAGSYYVAPTLWNQLESHLRPSTN